MTFPAFSPSSSAVSPLKDAKLPEWDLSIFYAGPSDPQIETDIEALRADVASFAVTYRGQVAKLAAAPDGGAALAGAFQALEALEDRIGRIGSYAGLLFATSSMVAAHAMFYGDIQGVLTELGSELIFFGLELNGLSDEDVAKLAKGSEGFAHYLPWIEDQRLHRTHDLSDDLERFGQDKSLSGRASWTRLFDEHMARLRFELDGESRSLEEVMDKLSDTDRALRERAVRSLVARFKQEQPLFAHITNTLSKDLQTERKWRGYEDVASARHISNRVEAPVVDALAQSVAEAHPRLSHRYYALKAKWLGLPHLEVWDRNAPLPKEDGSLISWDRAREIVLGAYGDFTPELASIAAPFFENGWINAAPREGKAGGAFAHPTVPSANPFILLNYMGRARDVMTLAHELGHGVHQVLASGQGALMAYTPLTLAETASVFGEMLTFKRLLSETKNKAQRKAMLAQKVEDMLNTSVRQIAFYTFERRLHEAREKGELSATEIGEIWMSTQGESLGPGVKLCDGYETFWCYIPHFVHSPFYVYAYAFGDCLVNSLYAVYEQSPDGFQDRYFEMLKAGGSKRHGELLAPFGLDASDPAFWTKGLGVIEGMIDELETLS
ncbi:MAG: M3 family oligoendopeptidase [Parvibaculum sp.]